MKMMRSLAYFRMLLISAVVLSALESPCAQRSPAPNGAALFSQRCLLCHGPGGRGPQLAAMGKLKQDTIYSILTEGIMKEQAAGLSEDERHSLADYIGRKGSSQIAISSGPPCASKSWDSTVTSAWNGWSPDIANSRFQPMPDVPSDGVSALTLKWALVFPDAASASNQATVVRGHLFIGSWDGIIYALDAKTGCSYWTYKANSGVRTPITIIGDRAYFGDFLANVYALNAADGTLLWRTKVDEHPYARVTAAITAFDDRIYVPVSSLEEGVAGDPNYACCTFRGSIVALDRESGKQIWKTYSIDETPKQIGQNKNGFAKMGPAGASIWSSPAIDAMRGAIYATTGNNYSGPNSPGADAVIAFDLKTGAKRWVRTMHPGDQWNASCLTDKTNCDEDGPDYDFGASPVVANLPNGKSLVLAGQKSGMLYALDPDHDGKTVWETRVGKGGSLGGVEWGFAVDQTRAYVAITDWEIAKPTIADGALSAVDLATGKILWRTPNPPGTCTGRQPVCSIANSAAVSVIPGTVFAGSLDGYLRAYDAATGRIVWEFDTNRDITGVNGVAGHGGSINGAGATIAEGMVFQTTGYAAYGLGIPGNALLVFGPPDKKSDAAPSKK